MSEKDFKVRFEIATAMKIAKENSQSINSTVSVNHSVHYLDKNKEKRDSSGSSSSFKMKSYDKNKHSFRCGNSHDPKICKYKEMKCYGCDKIGHPKFNLIVSLSLETRITSLRKELTKIMICQSVTFQKNYMVYLHW